MKNFCLWFFIFIYALVGAQPVTCDRAESLRDSACTFNCYSSKELWFKFTASERRFVMFVLSADSGKPMDYILYKGVPEFCKKVDSLIPIGVSFLEGPPEYTGITEEQLKGLCACNTCIGKERFLNLKRDSLYYLKVFPRGKDVFIKKDFDYVCEAPAPKNAYSEPIRIGKVIPIRNLFFIPESPQFLPESQDGLDDLYEFLNNNKSVHVQIKGHVNSPGKKIEASDLMLSQARANAVMSYLVKKGIDKERLTAKGFGNSEMIFPNPINEDQQKANRRVEILITKK